jgi:hypothetical protein
MTKNLQVYITDIIMLLHECAHSYVAQRAQVQLNAMQEEAFTHPGLINIKILHF